MWLPFWNLRFDPFASPGAGYVATPAHEEAVARLVSGVESGDRLSIVRGEAGTGKSVVLQRAAREVRGLGRRIARVISPVNEADLFGLLATQLGGQPGRASDRAGAWRRLFDALRVCQWHGLHPVVIVDQLAGPEADRIAATVEHLATAAPARLTFWLAGERGHDDPTREPSRSWRMAVGVRPLLRSESARYIAAKLAQAGRAEPAFTPSALTRLYERAGGIPRGLDRLAGLGLRAAALQSNVLVTEETIEGVADACLDDQTAAVD